MQFPPILFENEDVLVIDKPAGLIVHGDGKMKEITLADLILEKFPELKDVGEPQILNGVSVLRPGIVHRLDKDTSGVLLIAKNQNAFSFLKKQFQDRLIQKTYEALVFGWPKQDKGIIDAPIARSSGDIRKWTAFPKGKRGQDREAITEYVVLKRFEENNLKVSLLELYPKTGRTHQLRVHLQYLGYPIVCDSLYAPKKICFPEIGRLALLAKRLKFMLPSNEEIIVESKQISPW